MKWFAALWLLCAGVGISYSIVKERKYRIVQLEQMADTLKKLAYYMYQWKMPLKEALEHTYKEEQSWLQEFYTALIQEVKIRTKEDFGTIWLEQSKQFLEKQHALTGISKEIRDIWQESFLHIPMQPEALWHSLIQKAEKIMLYKKTLQETYKQEQRLVFTMGFFVSAFLCLIFW